MPNVLPYVKKIINPDLAAVKQNKAYQKDPEYFQPYSVQTFFGEQGSGKTIAMIHFYSKIAKQYPKAIVVSNVILHNRKQHRFATVDQLHQILNDFDTINDYIYYSSKDQYAIVNQHIRNGKFGVILITDEYQNYFSNQDSRNVPPWVIEQAAQNRKQRRLHLVTSQDYDQIAKPIRRRSDIAFKCRSYSLPFSYGPIITVYWAYDAKKLDFDNNGKINSARPLKFGFFFQTKQLRDSFDTHQVVFTGDQADNIYSLHQATVTPRELLSPKRKKGLFKMPRA